MHPYRSSARARTSTSDAAPASDEARVRSKSIDPIGPLLFAVGALIAIAAVFSTKKATNTDGVELAVGMLMIMAALRRTAVRTEVN